VRRIETDDDKQTWLEGYKTHTAQGERPLSGILRAYGD
jgi:hypothetical protein